MVWRGNARVVGREKPMGSFRRRNGAFAKKLLSTCLLLSVSLAALPGPSLAAAAATAAATAAPLPLEGENYVKGQQGGESGSSPLEWPPIEASTGGDASKQGGSNGASPVDVDEVATWWPPRLVDEARRSVVAISAKGRGLDIEPLTAPPAAGSGGVLVDASALLVGRGGKGNGGGDETDALFSSLASAVPAGTRFVLTSRRAVSAGFSAYDVSLPDGRKVEARLAYVDAFYPVAVLVVAAESGDAGGGGASSSSSSPSSSSLPAATLYPPPEDDARIPSSSSSSSSSSSTRKSGSEQQQQREQEEVLLALEAATSSSSSSSSSSLSSPNSTTTSNNNDVVVVEPNDPLLFLGQAGPEKATAGGATTTTTTTFVGYVSDLRAAFPKARSSGRGIRGVIARALVARRSPGPGGAVFDVSGRLFGLDVDRDVRGLVAPADKKAEVYVLPAAYLRDALARAVAATFAPDDDDDENKNASSSSSSPSPSPSPSPSRLAFPRADGGFAATLVPLGVAVDRYKLDRGIAAAVGGDARLSGWPNAGGTVPKVIKVSGVDFGGGIGGEEEEERGGVRAGDIVVGVGVEGAGGGVKRLLGDDLHALDGAFARAAAAARAAAETAPASSSAAASVFLATPSSSSSSPSSSSSGHRRPVVRLVVSRHGELVTVPARGIRLDNDNDGTKTTTPSSSSSSSFSSSLVSSPKIERVLLWAGCRFVDPPITARRLYQFGGAGVMLAACDRDSPLSAVVAADPREEDESSSSSPSASSSSSPPSPPPSKTPVLVTAIDGQQVPDLDALAALLSQKLLSSSSSTSSSSSSSSSSSDTSSSSPTSSPSLSSWNTTVAYRSIHTGRDTYSYVEGVSLPSFSSSSPFFLEFLWDARARSWVARTTTATTTTATTAVDSNNSTTATTTSLTTKTLSPSESTPLLPLSAEEYRSGKRNGNGAAAAAVSSSSTAAFFSRGKLAAGSAAAAAAAASPVGGGSGGDDEPPATTTPNDNDEPAQKILSSNDKPSSLSSETADWLSLAAKALGKAPTHASQSTWGTPEALLKIKQQAVQVAINDAIPLEHTDATPSAVGTGFVVDSNLGIIATNAHVCGPTIGGWEVMFFDGSVAPARQLWYSPTQDIALLSVEPSSIPFPNATAEIVSWKTLSDADKPRLSSEMEPVLEVGSPARFAFTTLQGVYLGAAYRAQDEVGRWRTRNYLKVHTLIQSVGGSSGGAVFNKLGKIVAIHFAGGSNSEFIAKFSASPYLWNSFEVAGDYVKSAVAFYKRVYGGGGGGGGEGLSSSSSSSSSTSSSSSSPTPLPSFSTEGEGSSIETPIKEPVRGGSGLVLDLVPLENAVSFFGMPPALAAEASLPGAPRPRSAMVVAGFEPGAPTRREIEDNELLRPGDIIWEVEDVITSRKERIGGDLIRLDELSGLAVEKSHAASSSSSDSSSPAPPPPHLVVTLLRRGELVENVTVPVYDLTRDRVRRALSWNGALFHDVSDRTRNYYQADVVDVVRVADVKKNDSGGNVVVEKRKKTGQGVFASYRAEGSAWPRFYHGSGGKSSSSTAFAKYLVYEVDGVATPDLDSMIDVACGFEASKKKKNSTTLVPPPTPSVVVARDLQDDSFPRGEAFELPVSQRGLVSTFQAPVVWEWDAARLVWRQRAACPSLSS